MFYTNISFTKEAHTWSERRKVPIGEKGDFGYPVLQRRFGSGRMYVFEICTTDDCRADIVAAEVQISPAGS